VLFRIAAFDNQVPVNGSHANIFKVSFSHFILRAIAQ